MPVSSQVRRSIAVSSCAATAVLAAAAFALGGGTFGGVDGTVREPLSDAFQLLSLAAVTVVGLTLAVRRPANPIGWLFSALGLLTAVYAFAGGYAIHAVIVDPGSLPGAVWAAWVRTWLDRAATSVVVVAFLLFPTGRLKSPRWRPAFIFAPLTVIGFLLRASAPGPLGFLGLPTPTPIEWLPRHVENGWVGGAPLAAGSLVAFGELISRFRSASANERDQIKWLALPLVALLVAIAATLVAVIGGVPEDVGVNGPFISGLYAIVVLLLPVCMAIAVLRYRLFDIDLFINRALVYAALSAVLAGAYVAGVAIVGSLLTPFTSGSGFAVAISTLGVLALFQPLRRRIQAAVDRRFYRARYDAARTLDDFTARLRDEVDLDAVRSHLVRAVRETVQPAHVGIWLRQRVP